MVILSVITAVAFSYKDFEETQKKNWLLEDQGISTLAKKLMNNVISENFVTTLEDLKELHNPFKDSFIPYKQSEIKTETLNSADGLDRKTINPDEYGYDAKIHEKPRVIPDFVGAQNFKDGDHFKK